MNDRKRESHPSYALLQISRISRGAPAPLFGSSLQHTNTIRLCISEGVVDRHLNTDWYHNGKDYIEVEMSYSQFAEAITSLNIGTGTPVTLRRLGSEKIDDCPYVDKKEQFESELKDTMSSTTEKLEEATKAIRDLFASKKNLTAKDKEFILDVISKATRTHNDSVPFIYSQFNDQMDKTVTEAKGEIESFVQNKMQALTLAAMQQDILNENNQPTFLLNLPTTEKEGDS